MSDEQKPACQCIAHKAEPGNELRDYGMRVTGYKWHAECFIDGIPNTDCDCCWWLYRELYGCFPPKN